MITLISFFLSIVPVFITKPVSAVLSVIYDQTLPRVFENKNSSYLLLRIIIFLLAGIQKAAEFYRFRSNLLLDSFVYAMNFHYPAQPKTGFFFRHDVRCQ